VKTRDDRTADFTFIDLFAGIGGLRYGFESIGGRCVFTCERDKYSQQTYRANFGDEHEIAADINDVVIEDIPSHDVLLAGFPCQPFSIAGVSKKNALNRPHGFACDAQGTLFFRLAEVIRHHRPKAFLLENVKNLLNHDKGNTFRVIRNVLEKELGYHIDWKVIDGKSWVPQHRERIFIVGFREPCGFSFDNMDIPNPLTGPKLATILHPEDGSEAPEPPYTDGNIGNVSDKYTLSEKLWQYLQDYAAKHKAKGNGFGFGLFGPEDVARTLSARYHKDGSEILIRREDGRPRRLTPRECARLMGFETDEREFRIPVSDTQAYRQFGNAVVVQAVEAVARHMLPQLRQVLAMSAEPQREAETV
jgi:DNA (cytosine-5)-methyltransferase 1